MPSHTVALERSAYERLKAAKRAGESFSVTVNRLLATKRPSFRLLAGGLDSRAGLEVRRAVDRMRKSEEVVEKARTASIRRARGRHR
jgi:predicted CopG family antitoxin